MSNSMATVPPLLDVMNTIISLSSYLLSPKERRKIKMIKFFICSPLNSLCQNIFLTYLHRFREFAESQK